jgi:hypothetical protein
MADKPITWRVTGQSETTGRGQNGTYDRGYRITFQTNTGLSGSVFVTKENYSKDYVLSAIRDQIKQMTEIAQLTEGSE